MVLHLATTGAEEVQQRHVLCAVVAVGTLGAVGGGQRVPREPRRRAGEDSPKKKNPWISDSPEKTSGDFSQELKMYHGDFLGFKTEPNMMILYDLGC